MLCKLLTIQLSHFLFFCFGFYFEKKRSETCLLPHLKVRVYSLNNFPTYIYRGVEKTRGIVLVTIFFLSFLKCFSTLLWTNVENLESNLSFCSPDSLKKKFLFLCFYYLCKEDFLSSVRHSETFRVGGVGSTDTTMEDYV